MPESAARDEGREATGDEIRIRITGTNNPHQDIEDLKAWLEREPWLGRRRHDWDRRPRPAEAPAAPAPGEATDLHDMAIGVDDLVLVVVGAVVTEITKSLGIALREWLRRRKEAREAGEQPDVSVGTGAVLRQIGGADPERPAGPGPGRPDPHSAADGGGSTGED
ncbi:hypothetical protein [Streptomyces sp. CT34]|uniref:hypothetical protein n=1 Tax=Streptomyces sp. CT34 TaxID=1553907 RepID=UPI0005B897FF|nr:hypothetical protein [Streptomyces sp. CT34]